MLIRSAHVDDNARLLATAPAVEPVVDPMGVAAVAAAEPMIGTEPPGICAPVADYSDGANYPNGAVPADAAASGTPAGDEEPVDAGPSYAELREQWELERQRLFDQASEQGYAAGEQAGRDAAEAQYAAEVRRLAGLVETARIALDSGIDGLAEVGAEVVHEAVLKIIGQSYMDQTGAAAVVREVVRHAKDKSRLLLRVSPDDYVELSEHKDVITGSAGGQVEILPDDRVELGGCLLETAHGNLDGRLEIQLQAFRDTLRTARARWNEAEAKS